MKIRTQPQPRYERKKENEDTIPGGPPFRSPDRGPTLTDGLTDSQPTNN